MQRIRHWVCLLVLGWILAVPSQANAAESRAKPPGIAAAETLSQVTGIAISPLLGVGAVGAYHYFNTPAERRPQLSWYAQPWFWAPALLIVGLCFLKDALGTALPTALKKPFDVLEVFENKVSALIATGAIIPMTLDLFRAVAPETHSGLSGAGLAAIDLSSLWGVLMIPIALVAYGVVFVVSHAINILILISPFSTVDALLKSFRTALLATVAGSAWISPTAGAIWAILIVLCCVPLTGWAFRLLVLGHVFAWDLLTFARTRTNAQRAPLRAFLARPIGKVPRRTYGTLHRDGTGNLVLAYRPWLIGSSQTLCLPAARHAIGKGFLYSELLVTDGDDAVDILDFPPRYVGHESALAEMLGLSEIRDVGLRAVMAWIRRVLGGGKPA